MHDAIMHFSAEHFYDSSLTAHPSVAQHTLIDVPEFQATHLSAEPAQFLDTAGAGWEEEIEPQGLSKRNPEEGRLILKKAQALRDAGLPARDIAVIAPYAAQVRWLRDHCDIENLEIDTVDGFQGREKEAVLITMVRCNREGEVGFLGDPRRMNVAMTRAKRKLIIVGDSATLSHEPFFVKLLDYFERIGGYHSVWEEVA
jgi:superfamily I DNA and/or RNA helicase